MEEGIPKGHKETFGVDGDVHSFDFYDGFTGVYRCQNLSFCIL